MSIVVSLPISQSEELTSAQFLFSQTIQNFCSGATHLEGLSTFAIAQMVFPLAKGFSLRCFSSFWKSSRAILTLSTGTACIAEATSLVATPILFQGRWKEAIGTPQGFIHSLATVGMLRGVGYCLGGVGCLLQVTQMVGLVCVNRALGEAPSQGFVADCIISSVTTVQSAVSGRLLQHLAPGIHQFAVREELRSTMLNRPNSAKTPFWNKIFPDSKIGTLLTISSQGRGAKINVFSEKPWRSEESGYCFMTGQRGNYKSYVKQRERLKALKQKHEKAGMTQHPIRQWRHEKGMKQKTLANLLEVNHATISLWETYGNYIPSIKMEELSKLEIPIHLFQEQEKPNQPYDSYDPTKKQKKQILEAENKVKLEQLKQNHLNQKIPVHPLFMWRFENKVKGEELAVSLGVHKRVIEYWEAYINRIDFSHQQKLRALGAPVDLFLEQFTEPNHVENFLDS